jgi:prevent-host-death family protein
MKQIGSEEARRTFRDLLDEAQRGEIAEVTRNGKPIAVLVPADWYHAAVEQLAEAAK